jgi:hypothetical protein
VEKNSGMAKKNKPPKNRKPRSPKPDANQIAFRVLQAATQPKAKQKGISASKGASR